MTPSDWITLAACLGTGIISLVGGTWILTWKLSEGKEATDKQVAEMQERMEEKFVCKNVCSVLHDQTKGDIERIERMVEKKFDGINETLNRLFELVRQNKG